MLSVPALTLDRHKAMQADDSTMDLEQQKNQKTNDGSRGPDLVIPISSSSSDGNRKTRRRKGHFDATSIGTDFRNPGGTVVIEHHYHHYHQPNGDVIKTTENHDGGDGPPIGMAMLSGNEIPGYLRNTMPIGGGWGNPISMLSFQQNNVQTNFTWILGCIICLPVTFCCVVLILILAGVFTWNDVWRNPV